MSSINVVAENAFNKVLPGDKTGLPWEIWQFVLSWMSARDLCRLACVSKTWSDLVISVDGTRWKQLYMACSEWRHPFWPLNTQAEPASWRLAYRDQYLATKFWQHRQQREARAVSCSLLFKKSVVRKTIHVGPGLEHECLKSALAVINEYDRVVVHPGIYDELFEISSKIPFELVGEGELGSVILVVGIQQVGAAARLSNLVFRAPWFTSFIIMLNSGYLQIDSCILEDGMICAQNPATVHIKFCTFRHATVILQHMNASIVENCEFSQSDSANIIVEGYPKEERNWTYGFLRERTDAVFSQKRSLHRKRRGLKTTTSLTSSTVHSSLTGKSVATNGGGWSSVTTCRQQSSDTVSHDPSFSMEDPGASFLNPNLLPGTRFLMLPPDNSGMVGCGDLQSLYHDGTCDAADTDQTLVYLTDGPKRRSVPGNIAQDVVQTSHQISETGKERHEGEKYIDKDVGVPKLSLTEGSESKASMCFLGPADIHLERGNQKPSQESCRKDEKEFAAAILPHKPLQEAWVDSEALKKPLDTDITIQRKCGDERKCDILDETGNISSESNQATVFAGKESNETSNINPAASVRNLICRRKQARRRQTPVEPLDGFNVVEPQMDQNSPAADDKHLKKNYNFHKMDTEKQLSNAHVEHNMHSHEKDPYIKQGKDNKGVLENEMFSHVCRFCLKNCPENSNDKGYPLEEASSQIGLAENPSCSKSYSCKDDLGCTKCVDLCKPGPSSEGLNAHEGVASPSMIIDLEENKKRPSKACDNSSATSQICVCYSGQMSTLAPLNDIPSNSHHQSHLFGEHSDLLCSHQQFHSQDNQYDHDHRYRHHHLPSHCDNQEQQQLPPIHIPIRRSQSQELENPVSDDDLSILDELADSDDSSDVEDINNHNSDSDTGSSTTDSSSFTNSLRFSGSEDSFASSEESVIMLPHLREFHAEGQDHLNQSTTSPRGVQAEVASINSECTRPVPVDVSEDTLMSSYVGQIQGCLIHQCRMNHSKGGLMISLQAHAIVSECDISNVSYGIRCIQNSRAVILKNKIHHCRTSGIFMRLAASGLIAGNDIHSNNEAGIDIRKNADPLVQFNQIHHGKRSGVVVLGSGRGQIKKNDIYRNQEAGVYVLYGGNPTISENYIYEGRAAGVAVNAGGKGCIIDNVIRGNQWGGVDIRNGSCPLVAGNSIINGLSDGIVVGLSGRGSIESNFISGNGGCGLWMMAAKNLYIHGNQISNSGHCGVMLLNKSASAMESHLGQLLTNVSRHSFSHHDDNTAVQEPKTNWATLQYNNIFNNNGHGVVIEIKEEVHMLYNAVHGNHRDGILMSQSAPVLLQSNSITSNCGNGVVTSTHDKVHLLGNGIYDNGHHGMVCRTSCIIEGNDVAGHIQASVLVEVGADVQLRENRLCSSPSGVCAVVGEDSAVIMAVNNKIFIRGGRDFGGCGKLTTENNILIRPSSDASRRQSKGEFNKTEFLTDPPPRPHIVPPPPSTVIPSHYVTVVTKVTLPSAESCEQGSKFCIIL